MNEFIALTIIYAILGTAIAIYARGALGHRKITS